jgi:hypothetical protein
MSPAAAARSILIKAGTAFLETETAANCDGVGIHLADERGGMLLSVAADGPLAGEVRSRDEVPAVALLVDVPRSPNARRPLPRLQLTGWLSESTAQHWADAGGWPLAATERVLRLDPQLVVLLTDHGAVDVDLDDYQDVPAEQLPIAERGLRSARRDIAS